MTRVRVVSLRSFDRLIADLSPKAYRAWARSIEWAIVLGTDGFLAADDIKAIGPTPAAHKELLQRGVWKVDHDGRTFVAELREGPVVAEVEGCEVKQLSSNAERQKRYRERKRNTVTRVTPETVTRDGDSNVTRDATVVMPAGLSLSGSESSPDLDSSSVLASDSELLGSARDSEIRAKPASKQQGKHRMPEGFPTEEQRNELLKYGRKKGLRDGQTEGQIEACQIWARSSGALKLDWFATCQGFIRSFASDERRPPGAVQHEKTREEASKRPELGFFRDEPEIPADERVGYQEIKNLTSGITRRIGNG